MASGSGSSDDLGLEGRATTKSLGKATQENEMNAESQLGAIAPPLNGKQDYIVSKGKRALHHSEYGHHDSNKNIKSSTSWTVGSFQGAAASSSKNKLKRGLQEEESRSKTDGPCPGQSNLQAVAASAAPDGPTVVEPDVSIFVCNDSLRAEPHVGSTVGARHGVALIAASPNMVLNQPRIAPAVAPNIAPVLAPVLAPNFAPLASTLVRTDVAHSGEAPVRLDVASHAQRNGGPPLQPRPNVALIAVADAQPNAAEVDAPPFVFDFDVNAGLRRSLVRPLRICDIESEGHIWAKLPRR